MTPWLLFAVADTLTALFGASTVLSLAVIVTVPLLDVWPAAMVSALFMLSAKSPATAGGNASAETVTVVVWLDA